LGGCGEAFGACGGGLDFCDDGFGDAVIISVKAALGMMVAVKRMIVDGQAGEGDVIEETKAAFLKSVVGVGTTG